MAAQKRYQTSIMPGRVKQTSVGQSPAKSVISRAGYIGFVKIILELFCFFSSSATANRRRMSPSNAGNNMATSSSHHHHNNNNNNVIPTTSKTHLRRYGARLATTFTPAGATPVQLYQSQFAAVRMNNNATQQQQQQQPSTNVDNQRARGMSRQQQVAQQISRQAHKNAKGICVKLCCC